ncbi:MAG: YigZ family protein [Gemmatimonadota bacterium]|nr:YigZ family protein [Gemmatimonadota bacterium]MDE2870296.1 YigZ family protein [Gemmatimonadota bacterium]
MPQGYLVPAATAEVEDVVRRSRFITRAGRATCREEALRFVGETRDLLPGATHYCWAYNAGPPGSTAHVGMSDAGEPRGTAGMPMLTTLLHSGVGEVVVVCARYFGGVKLGTGGLARAYAGGANNVLRACPTTERIERIRMVVTMDYEDSGRVDRALDALGAIVADRNFGADVRYGILVPVNRKADLYSAIAKATGGRGRLGDGAG